MSPSRRYYVGYIIFFLQLFNIVVPLIFSRSSPRLPVQLYYLCQCGFYLYSIAALLAWETRRKDFAVMMSHHVITVILLGVSYLTRYHLYVMRVPKNLKLIQHESFYSIILLFVVITWNWSQHYRVSPFIILYPLCWNLCCMSLFLSERSIRCFVSCFLILFYMLRCIRAIMVLLADKYAINLIQH